MSTSPTCVHRQYHTRGKYVGRIGGRAVTLFAWQSMGQMAGRERDEGEDSSQRIGYNDRHGTEAKGKRIVHLWRAVGHSTGGRRDCVQAATRRSPAEACRRI